MDGSAVHMTARGRVQGVGFRFFVRELASLFGVKGWVRNCSDGAVEIYAEGNRDVLREFMERVKDGPRFGSVHDLDVEWTEPSNDYASFTIEF